MAAEGKIRDQGHGAGHTFPAKPHLTLATWSSLAPSTELGRLAASCPHTGAASCLLVLPGQLCTGVGSQVLRP